MQKPQIYNKNYNMESVEYQLSLPLDLLVIIPENDPVRLLSEVLEDLNYSELIQAYSHVGRKPYSPIKLFKIMVYAYMENIYSSRKIEWACRKYINFMWLCQGEVPDHNTISRFRSERLSYAIERLFYQFVMRLFDWDEIDFKHLFIDGTKIEANANRYSFVWKKAIDKNEPKLQAKISKLFIKIKNKLNIHINIKYSNITVSDMEKVVSLLETYIIEHQIELVNGKGHRKHEAQKYLELLKNDYIVRQTKYDYANRLFKGRNSFSKTDTDATFMHMKEDHMRNGQLKPGYNVQLGVSGEYIVGMNIYNNRNDVLTLIPFLNYLRKQLSDKQFEAIVADMGYSSEEIFVYLSTYKYRNFIKPLGYNSEKEKKFQNDISKRENMKYIKEEDVFVCANNKVLKYLNETKDINKLTGYVSTKRKYACEDCTDCPLKPKCTKAKGNKTIEYSPLYDDLKKEAKANISSEEGIQLRVNRSIQAEGTFGVLKENWNFRRFLLRGENNVKTEMFLLCFGFNISKLHNKIQNDKTGVLIH